MNIAESILGIKMRKVLATEHQEQCTVVDWLRLKYPNVFFFSIPNGANKSFASAVKFKKEGQVAGIPDLFIAQSSGNSHGLFIEMKRRKGGRVSPEQQQAALELTARGYVVRVCYGAEEAMEAIAQYLPPVRP